MRHRAAGSARRTAGAYRRDAAQGQGIRRVGNPTARLELAVVVAAEPVDQLPVLRPHPLIAAATRECRHRGVS